MDNNPLVNSICHFSPLWATSAYKEARGLSTAKNLQVIVGYAYPDMKAGIIGLQSVGKTTIFNVLTHGKAAAGPGGGRKLEPNVGIVKVPDVRVDFLATKFNPEKKTYAS